MTLLDSLCSDVSLVLVLLRGCSSEDLSDDLVDISSNALVRSSNELLPNGLNSSSRTSLTSLKAPRVKFCAHQR